MSIKSSLSFVTFWLLCTTSGQTAEELIATIERIKPSIVVVGTYNRLSSPQFQMRGTGFVIASGNLVATNAHVVPESIDPESRIAVLQSSGSRDTSQVRQATVVSRDKEHDLAVLRIEPPFLPALQVGNSDVVKEGLSIAFTGFPIGGALGFSPVTHRGMISSITPIVLPNGNSRQLNEKLINQIKRGTFKIFQLDATAYPGNSGSPVFDTETGHVIGILNMVFIKGLKETALTQPSGISYAIPSNYLSELSRSLTSH